MGLAYKFFLFSQLEIHLSALVPLSSELEIHHSPFSMYDATQ